MTRGRHCAGASRFACAALSFVALLPAFECEGREHDLLLERPDWTVASAFPTGAGAPGAGLELDADGVADLVLTGAIWRGTLLRQGGIIPSQRTPLFATFPGGIARRGDLNGDGRDDLVLGYPEADNRRGFNFLGGRVAVFWTPRPDPDAPAWLLDYPQGDWTLIGGFETSLLGRRVAVGDVNGDGFQDLVAGGIGQIEVELGGSTQTCIYGVFGPLQDGRVVDLRTDTTDFRMCQSRGGPAECSFGQSMAVGDFDGDGFDDLAASCSDGVRIFLGQRLTGDVDWDASDSLIVVPTASRGQANRENMPLVARDIDGDGRDDLLIGLVDGDGEVDLVLGSAPLPALIDLNVTPADLAVLGRPDSGLGSSIAVGRFTTDGTLSLALGAPRSDGPSNVRADAGAVDILSSIDTLRGVVDLAIVQPAELLHGAEAGDALGSGRWGIGLVVADLSGDGVDDIAMHSPGPGSEVWYGRADVVFGRPQVAYDLWHSIADPSALALLAADVTSPWDGAPGLLDDGALHFFRIDEVTTVEATLFVTKQETDGTVRISWLDASPAAIPPDALLSSVVASSDCVRSDAEAVADVTVTPRDASGERLGAGLDVRPTNPANWPPGVPVGGFADKGDGSYRLQVVASISGMSIITVEVDGVALAETAVIDFTSSAPDVTVQAVPSSGAPGVEVSLSATVVGGAAPFTYAWDLDGDGSIDSREETPSRVYSAGAWRAVVTVTDAAACVGRGIAAVTVRP